MVFATSTDTNDSVENYDGVKIHHYGTILRYKKGALSLRMFQDTVNFDMDVAHVHFSTPLAEFAALRYTKKRGVPLVIHYHGDWVGVGSFFRRTAISAYNRYLLDKVLSQARLIICPSPYYITESRFLGKYKDKITIVPNGVKLEDFELPYSKEECRLKLGLSLDNMIILFMGNLFPYKAPDVLIKAMPEIVRSSPRTTLVLAGKGVLEGKLKELTRSLGVNESVQFPGYVTGELKAAYYNAADVFVLPSTMGTEVFPLVLLEASASCLPMVVSDLETFKCIIEDNYNGIVTKRGSDSDLARAIIYLLKNPSLRSQMGENAKKKAQAYSWDKIAAQTEEVYYEVLKR